jgi:hypothetical protein
VSSSLVKFSSLGIWGRFYVDKQVVDDKLREYYYNGSASTWKIFTLQGTCENLTDESFLFFVTFLAIKRHLNI